MSEFEPLEAPDPATPSRGRRVLGRVLLSVGWTLAALAALGIALYLFGGMWVRTAEMRSAYEDMVASGQQPQLARTLVMPIPGCVCHSADPVVQAQHATRRIRDCFTCH